MIVIVSRVKSFIFGVELSRELFFALYNWLWNLLLEARLPHTKISLSFVKSHLSWCIFQSSAFPISSFVFTQDSSLFTFNRIILIQKLFTERIDFQERKKIMTLWWVYECKKCLIGLTLTLLLCDFTFCNKFITHRDEFCDRQKWIREWETFCKWNPFFSSESRRWFGCRCDFCIFAFFWSQRTMNKNKWNKKVFDYKMFS